MTRRLPPSSVAAQSNMLEFMTCNFALEPDTCSGPDSARKCLLHRSVRFLNVIPVQGA